MPLLKIQVSRIICQNVHDIILNEIYIITKKKMHLKKKERNHTKNEIMLISKW